ncbi:hypothetical protein E4U52_005956 [Claviceps spartinae]|nr:hypothetical protein E4U52_005956 [Claviceps spartinae]
MRVPQTFSNVLMASPGDFESYQPQQRPRDDDTGNTCILDVRTSENPQPRIEEKIDSLAKDLCVEREKILVTKSKEAEGLRSEVKSLREQLQREKKETQEKVSGLTTTIQRLDEDKIQLRLVIPENILRHKVCDVEIWKRFVSIRCRIKAVVDNSKYDMTRKFMPRDAADDFELRFYQQYNSYCPADRVLLMRATVYHVLYCYILGRDAFGLAGSDPLLRVGVKCTQDAPEVLLDRFLSASEGLLRPSKGAVVLYLRFSASSHANKPLGTNEVISNWRLATFKCIETFSAALPPRRNTIARDQIRRLLHPLLSFQQDTASTNKEIDWLCDAAFALWLSTTKSVDQYQFDGPKLGEKCPKDTVEVSGVIGNGKASNFVAFSIWGALTKKTGNKGSEITCVLEPANVVVLAQRARQGK